MVRLLLLATSLLTLSQSKVVQRDVRLSSQDTEQFLAKFSFSPGALGEISGEFVVDHDSSKSHRMYFDNHVHQLQVLLFNDAAWAAFNQKMQAGSLCKDRAQLATYSKNIGDARVRNKEERMSFSYKADMQDRSHYWYALLADCYLEEYDAHPPSIRTHLVFLNQGQHLPADEVGLDTFLLLLLLAAAGFGIFYAIQVRKQLSSSGQVHLVVVILGAAYFAQFLSILFEWMHLNRYSNDGKGFRWRHTWLALDFLAELCQGESEILIQSLLIFLAFGWTLLPPVRNHGSWQDPAAALRGVFCRVTKESMIFCAGLFVFQTFLELSSRGYDEDFNSFHDHEHLPGYIFVVLRLVLGGVFYWGTTTTLQHCPPDEESFQFLGRLRGFGTCWFCAFPAIVLLAPFVSETSRHSFVMGSTILLQVVACALLSTLFFTRGGKYFKISSLSKMTESLPMSSAGSGLSVPSSFGSFGSKLNMD